MNSELFRTTGVDYIHTALNSFEYTKKITDIKISSAIRDNKNKRLSRTDFWGFRKSCGDFYQVSSIALFSFESSTTHFEIIFKHCVK